MARMAHNQYEYICYAFIYICISTPSYGSTDRRGTFFTASGEAITGSQHERRSCELRTETETVETCARRARNMVGNKTANQFARAVILRMNGIRFYEICMVLSLSYVDGWMAGLATFAECCCDLRCGFVVPSRMTERRMVGWRARVCKYVRRIVDYKFPRLRCFSTHKHGVLCQKQDYASTHRLRAASTTVLSCTMNWVVVGLGTPFYMARTLLHYTTMFKVRMCELYACKLAAVWHRRRHHRT